MNQLKSGALISSKRREKNLTQAELAERIGVSNKTISKWETGKCMPDYSVVEALCSELSISASELLNGEEKHMSDDAAMRIMERLQVLERQKKTLIGIVLIAMGIAMFALGQTLPTGISGVKDFFVGLVIGLGVGEMLVGVFITALSFGK